ncbi:MAG: 2-amino-4-hydroxy-6-hydroxymethyldihydropteridine diphosphokinase [Desulfobacterales bacterium]|nr:2-amino-4-hydroxy-6-hydroxymethyldihydropteridine diphosphokinase [Desulfobacterales bacterium]
MEIHTAYISVGSNIGKKLSNCQNAVCALVTSGKNKIKGISRYYITEPVDYENQDWFVNLVIKIETILDPFQLLDELKSIERNAGRVFNTRRFSPRILDLDILIFADCVIDSRKLVIPHPRMHKRRFVLKPFCDIDSRKVHPILKKEFQYLLDNLDDHEQKVFEHPCVY